MENAFGKKCRIRYPQSRCWSPDIRDNPDRIYIVERAGYSFSVDARGQSKPLLVNLHIIAEGMQWAVYVDRPDLDIDWVN